MSFDVIDNLLIDILLTFSESIEDCNSQTLQYKFNLTPEIIKCKDFKIEGTDKNDITELYTIIYLGHYNSNDETFKWSNSQIINMVYEQLQKNVKSIDTNIKEMFGTTQTIDKLFEPEVKIILEQHYAIPYLIQLLFNINLVRFESPNKDIFIYTLIKLNFDCPIDHEDFIKKIVR